MLTHAASLSRSARSPSPPPHFTPFVAYYVVGDITGRSLACTPAHQWNFPLEAESGSFNKRRRQSRLDRTPPQHNWWSPMRKKSLFFFLQQLAQSRVYQIVKKQPRSRSTIKSFYGETHYLTLRMFFRASLL
jgi:hypothetical protein